MLSDIERTLTISSVERFGRLSKDGCPRYRVTFTDGPPAETEPDAQVNYLIPNSEYQGVPVKVMFNRKGLIKAVRLT